MKPQRRNPWTMQEIAAAAGVSVTTVSHALSGKRPVNPVTAGRILRLIEESGYVPDAGARRLKSGRSRVIGLAVPDISYWYFGRIARGVEEVANEWDHGLIICSTSNSDPRREHRYFDMLRTRLIDGLVYTASRDMTPTDELARMAAMSPIVLADEGMPLLNHLPSVTSDNYEAARGLGLLLTGLGHRLAVVISGPRGLKSQVERVQGIKESFPNALVLEGDFELRSGYDLVADLLAHEVKFTAVLCCNDLMAVGAIQRLRDEGIRVPDDVSVVGFDDVDIAALVTPGLTTVRQDALRIGRESARILLEGLESGELDSQASVILPTELVIRGSSGPARAETDARSPAMRG